MSTLEQIRTGFSNAWENLTEGWHELRRRAGHALTRFNPSEKSGDLQTRDEQFIAKASRWGFMAAEVSENDSEIVVKLEAPGMTPENFQIQVVDDYLVVQGEKQVEREEQRGRFYVMERAYGSFERAVPLPSRVDEEGAKAKYRRGVLRITLPKSATARSRRIEVHPG